MILHKANAGKALINPKYKPAVQKCQKPLQSLKTCQRAISPLHKSPSHTDYKAISRLLALFFCQLHVSWLHS